MMLDFTVEELDLIRDALTRLHEAKAMAQRLALEDGAPRLAASFDTDLQHIGNAKARIAQALEES